MAYINKQILTAVVAAENGEIFELDGYNGNTPGARNLNYFHYLFF